MTVADSTKYSANAEAILALVDSHQIDLVYESIPDTSSKRGLDNPFSYQSKGFEVYPNPANTILNISLEQDEAAILEIHGIQGRKLYTHYLTEGNTSHEVDVSSLPQGTYFVEIIQDESIYNTKIVILR